MAKTIEITNVQIGIGAAATLMVSILAGYASYTNAIHEIKNEFTVLRAERAQSFVQKNDMQTAFQELNAKLDGVSSRLYTIEGYLKSRLKYNTTSCKGPDQNVRKASFAQVEF